jgi:hypothetical protein
LLEPVRFTGILFLLLVGILRIGQVVRIVHFAGNECVVRIAFCVLIDRNVRANALVLDRLAAWRVVVLPTINAR